MEKEETLQVPTKQPLTRIQLIRTFLLMILNAVGVVAWINLYNIDKFTGWWVFVIMIVCGISTLIYGYKFANNIRNIK